MGCGETQELMNFGSLEKKLGCVFFSLCSFVERKEKRGFFCTKKE